MSKNAKIAFNFLPDFKFPLLAKFFNSFRTDTFSVCYIPFRFSDGVPLIFLNQSLFGEFQGIT